MGAHLTWFSKDTPLVGPVPLASFDILHGISTATIAVCANDHRIVYANISFCRQFGFPDSSETLDCLVSTADLPLLRRQIAKLLASGAADPAPLRLHLATGVETWFAASFSRLPASADCILMQFIDNQASQLASDDLRERESRWNAALIGSGLGVWDHDFATGRMTYSDTWRSIRGYGPHESPDTALENWILSVHPDDRENVVVSIERQNAGDPAYSTFVYRERHRDGHWIWIECRGACVEWDENGAPTRIIGTDTDVTARKAAEELLNQTSRRLDIALKISSIGVFEANLETAEVEWDDRLLAIYGLENTPRLKPAAVWRDAVHPDDLTRVNAEIESHIRSGEAVEQEYRIVRPDGAVRVVRGRAALFSDSSGRSKMIGANYDVTPEVALRDELKQAYTLAEARNRELETAKERIEHIALHDHLTGLPNRRYLDRVLSVRADECRRAGSVLVILHVDLDRFKQINDTLGHRAGDTMLKHAAHVLNQAVSSGDFVARIGGDEFVIVCTRKTLSKKIESLAAHVIRELYKPVRYEGHDIRFGASIGIAFDSGFELDAKQVFLNADIALYRAKRGGRNRHEFFSLDARQHIVTTKRVSDEILEGLELRQFRPFYQPQFCAHTLDVVGVETLVRWHHPQKGILTPDHFLPVAEDLDVVGILDGQVLEQALDDRRLWNEMGVEFPRISVNVSARRLADPNLAKILRALEIKPGTVSFELLESISLDNCDEESIANLKLLRRIGIDIEIDDFGTGHASIVSLLRLSPKTLKIDRELIKPLTKSAEQRRLVGSIIEIGRSQNIRVTAEGVETMEHARILAELGCDSLQGYALAKPMPASDIPQFILGQSWREKDRPIQAA